MHSPPIPSMASSTRVGALALQWLCLALCVTVIRGREFPSHQDLEGHSNHTKKSHVPRMKGLIEDASFTNFGRQHSPNLHPNAIDRVTHYGQIKSAIGTYYGTKADINVWQPICEGIRSSSAAISISNGLDSPENFNTIVVGWHVFPTLYGDIETHFFVMWNNGKEACFNIECQGFVPANTSPLEAGSIINKVSTYNGEQYYLSLKIYKEPKSGDWELRLDDKIVGFWPKDQFTSLADSASEIAWGGSISFLNTESGPEMGSGKYPSELEGKAASFKHIQLVDSNGNLYGASTSGYTSNADNPNCYKVGEPQNEAGNSRFSFYFGGPSGCKV